jgi:hypothetical protein
VVFPQLAHLIVEGDLTGVVRHELPAGLLRTRAGTGPTHHADQDGDRERDSGRESNPTS